MHASIVRLYRTLYEDATLLFYLLILVKQICIQMNVFRIVGCIILLQKQGNSIRDSILPCDRNKKKIYNNNNTATINM